MNRTRLTVLAVVLSAAAGAQTLDRSLYWYVNWEAPHQVLTARITASPDGTPLKLEDGRELLLLGVDGAGAHKVVAEFLRKNTDTLSVVLAVAPGGSAVQALVFYRDKSAKTRCLNWELVKRAVLRPKSGTGDQLCRAADWKQMGDAAAGRSIRDYYYLAEKSAVEGLEEDVVRFYQEALRQYPEEMGFYEGLAAAYSRMNLPGFEVDAYLAYLERNPSIIEMRRKLANAYEKMADAVPWYSRDDYLKKALNEWQIVKKNSPKYQKEAEKHILAILTR